jgi:hypothetical protein
MDRVYSLHDLKDLVRTAHNATDYDSHGVIEQINSYSASSQGVSKNKHSEGCNEYR